MIRRSTEEDHLAIRELLDKAFFPSRFESRLRSLVVTGGETFEEWVVERDSRIIGHILYTVATDGTSPIGYHLAPVSIHPDHQRQGIGSRLIRETLEMPPLADQGIFVVGDPDYYGRFGFVRPATATCPFDEGNRHFGALRWKDYRKPFVIGYAPAFHQAEME